MRRLLVVELDSVREKGEDAPVYILDVSPSGIRFYDKYIDRLIGMEKHPIQVVTDISFDQQESFPSLRFATSGENTAGEIAMLWKLRTSGEALLMQEPSSEKVAA